MTRRRPEGRIRKAYSTRALMSLVVTIDMATTIRKKTKLLCSKRQHRNAGK